MSGTLVLLHGVASNATRWAEFVEHARLERWKILRPDLRGNGTAALPRTRLGMDVWCDDLVAMLDRERCERAVIGGHCLGANIALQFAAHHASRVRALVLIEPMPPQALAGSAAWLPYLRPVLLALYGASRALNACGIYRRRLAPQQAAIVRGDVDRTQQHIAPADLAHRVEDRAGIEEAERVDVDDGVHLVLAQRGQQPVAIHPVDGLEDRAGGQIEGMLAPREDDRLQPTPDGPLSDCAADEAGSTKNCDCHA